MFVDDQEVKVYPSEMNSKHLAHPSVSAPLLARHQHIHCPHTKAPEGPFTVNP